MLSCLLDVIAMYCISPYVRCLSLYCCCFCHISERKEPEAGAEPAIIQVNVIDDEAAARALAAQQEEEAEQVERHPYIYDGSCAQFMHFYALKLVSLVCKPYMILNVHMLVYSVHMILAVCVLAYGWHEKCQNNLHSLVSLFFARAAIGMRICHWQTHSTTMPPNCAEIFFKVTAVFSAGMRAGR